MQDITVRQMDFQFPDGMDPVVIPGEPEQSYGIVGLSLLLPYLEPYLIRTMKEAKKVVTDPELRADLEKFSAQEGQHYQQHIRFNNVIREWGFPRLEEFENELDADYRRFSETKSLRWNLAYAEGFEAFTTAGACFSFETGGNDGMHPAHARAEKEVIGNIRRIEGCRRHVVENDQIRTRPRSDTPERWAEVRRCHIRIALKRAPKRQSDRAFQIRSPRALA